MKDMLLAKKAELQKRDKKGFTLMELLIVVAIIAVLVAIAIPMFTAQLEKSREATDLANVRSAYAEVIATYLSDNKAASRNVSVHQTQSGWQGGASTIADNISVPAKTSGSYTVSINASGTVTIS